MKNITKANLIGVSALFLWSFSALLVTFVKTIPTFQLIYTTCFICFLFYLIKWSIYKQSISDAVFLSMKSLLIMVCGIGGYFIFYYSAFKMAPAIQVNLLNYLWPVLIIVFAKFIFRSHELNLIKFIGISLAFIGASLVITNGGDIQFEKSNIFGYIFALIAAVIWALYSNLTRLIKFKSDSMGLVFLFISVISFIIHIISEDSYLPKSNEWLSIVLLSLVNMGYASWDFAMKKGNIQLLASLAYFVPVLSTLILIIVLNQKIEVTLLISAGLIIVGGFFSNFKSD